ncbi:MAG: NUDIX domain-containing protein [Pirellulales bacterium]|nr:NUDIX domain-containing protein [Pirellulales bacterium]
MTPSLDNDASISQVGIGIVRCQRKYLVGVRARETILGGFAEFPGGKCDPGEPIEDTVIRECLEETGLNVDVQRLLACTRHTYEHGELELSFFLCAPASGQCESPQGSFRWVEKCDLATMRFPPANDVVLRMLVENSGV